MVNSRSFRNAVAVTMVVLLTTCSVWAAESAEPSADGVLRAIPAGTLFCVRINNLDNTLTAANEFVKGIAPESFDAKAAVVTGVLGKALGDENLTGVNMKRDFAVFAMNVPGDSPSPMPMGDMFIGVLIPVRDYDDFISGSPNLSEPDNEGISTITMNGQPNGFATNFRRFALLSPPGNRDKLIRVKELMGQRGQNLSSVLDAGEIELAANSPAWLYLNVKQGSNLVGPMIFGQLEQMKVKLQEMKEKGEGPPMVDPSGIVNFYGGIFKMLMSGTEYIMVGLSPTSEMCNITVGMKAVPGTEMAEIVGGPVEGNFENLLGYLDNGTMMNLVGKVDHKSLKATYIKLFELMGQMTTEKIPEEDLTELKNLTTKMIDAIGDSLAISFGVSSGEPPVFSIKYVIKVRDEEAFKQVIEKELRMMQEGAFAKIYKGFGMEVDLEVERDADTYKGIKIDAAKAVFKMGDEDSLQGQMLQKIFGDGLDYRWALVEGYCVYSIGSNTKETIRKLIDQVKAGHPKQIGTEIKAAMEAIPNSSKADAVGTFNYVRILNMALGFMLLSSESPPQLAVPTESNIAFAAQGITDGKATLKLALPKKHLMEIKSAFETLIPQIEKQEELKRQKQKE